MAMGGSSQRPVSPAVAPLGYQPPWNVGERWANGPRYTSRRMALKQPIGRVGDVMTVPSGTFAQNTGQVILLANGNVLIGHRSGANNAPFIYDPYRNVLYSTPFTTISGFGIQLPDSTLLSLVAGSPGAVYDLNYGRIGTLGTTIPAGVGFLRLSGWELLLFTTAGGAMYRYDVRGDNITRLASTWPASGFDQPILLPNGRVFIPPVSSSTGRVYDLVQDQMITTCTFPNIGAYTFTGSCVLPNGEVFCSPRNSASANIYNPVTDTVRSVSGFDNYGAIVNYGISCVLMPDGRVLIPVFATSGGNARIYDPVTNTVFTTSMTWPSSYGMGYAVVLQDGRIYCCAFNSTTSRIYGNATYSIPPARLLPSLLTPS